jgi:GAF domain-containing protein
MSTAKLPNKSYDNHDTARLAFMLKLVDTLHSMPDTFAIEDGACRLLAENLPVEFAWFAEIGPDKQQITIRSQFIRDRSIRLTGVYPYQRLQSLARAIEAEQPYILDDAFQSFQIDSPERSFYESNRILSCLAFPVMKGTRTLTYIAIADEAPRHWMAREVSLVHETAVRVGDAIRDITRRKLYEEALCKSEQRMIAEAQTKNTAYGQLLRKQFEEVQHERANLLQKLNVQVTRLHKLICDLRNTTTPARS